MCWPRPFSISAGKLSVIEQADVRVEAREAVAEKQ